MVDKKTWFAVGYATAFLSIYLLSILYMVGMNWTVNTIPETNTYLYTMNTTSGLASTSSWLPLIGVTIAAGVVVSTLISSFSFKKGVENENPKGNS